jgi:hypothetical protein
MDLTPNQRLLRLIGGSPQPSSLRNQVCCTTCRYSHASNGAIQCRRYAPHPDQLEAWDWPNVDGTDWCGEWSTL